MAFPKNFVCVNLVDFPVLNDYEKINAKKIFLPIEMCEKYRQQLFGIEKRNDGKLFLDTKRIPQCLPKNFFKKRNRKFNGFFLLGAVNDKKQLRFVDEKKLANCCQMKNVRKWLKVFEKNENCEIFEMNRTLYRICALILSCCRIV
jgi:hypothetical protein